MKSLKFSAIILLTGLVILFGLFSSAVYARNYNYDVLEKAKSLQFDGTFTVERDGQTTDVHELKPGDEITSFTNSDAYDAGYHPGECKQFVNIILHEVTGDHDLPNNGCINGACGGYYENFSKDIKDVVPGDILHCYYGDDVWHTMIALAAPEIDGDGNQTRIYVLDSNWSSHHTVALRYHDLKKYTAYGYSKGWEYSISYLDQSNSKSAEDPITLAPGEIVNASVRWKNEGREPWSNDPAEVTNIYLAASDNPLDPTQVPPTRHSSFACNWIDSNWKVCYPDETSIEKGDITRFTFQMQAPATPGEYTEYFYPYHVSGGWVPNKDTRFPAMHVTIIVQDEQAIDVGEGAPTEEIRQVFVDTYSSDLGSSTSTVQGATSSFGTSGYYQTFKYGSIQYLADGPYAGQAFALYGKLYEKWGNMGCADSPLGFPTIDRVEATSSFGATGIYQLFEGGSLQLNGIDPFAVYGAVYDKWGDISYADGPLGFPAGDPTETTSGFETVGTYQTFEGGSIQVIGVDAYSIYNEIYNEWGHQGYATWVGFPESDRYSCAPNECQDFEGGCIQSDGQTAEFISTTHPINLAAEVNPDGLVDLSWDNQITARGINVYREGSPVERIAVLDPGETSYVDDTAVEGHHYIYYLGAYNETAESPYSNKMAVNGGLLDDGPWSMFMHDVRHTGRSIYRVATEPALKWRHHIDGYVYSSSSISSDGTIYVGNHDRTAAGWYEYLYAINPDGSLKWRYNMDSHVSITSTPAIGSDGTLYVGAYYYYISYTPRGYLYAINPNGSLLWRYDVGACRVRTSPTIDSAGTIYFGADDDYLYAINPDGTLLWRYKTDGDIKSSPAIDSSGTIYVGSFDNYLYAINPDGTLLWRYKTDGDIKSSPAIDSSGTIYVGSYDNYLYAINPDGSIKWRYRTDDDIHSSPAIDSSGTIYVGSYDNYLYAINPDGTIKWRYRTDNDIHSSPSISSDGSVYIASHDYYFYAIGLQQGKGELHGRITDWGTLAPISSATISTSDGDTESKTDGTYSIALFPGVYDITVSKAGYQTITIPNAVVIAEQFTELNIELNIDGPLNIVTTDMPPAEIGVEYNARVRISGGTYPYTYSIAYGSLPPGLSIDTATGTITGIPTLAGTYTFAVGIEDSENSYAEREFSIEVTEELKIITESPLSRGTRGTEYFGSIEATGGTLPHSFSRISGSLPPGMSLSSGGSLTGTPSSSGSYDFTVRVTDTSSRTAEKTFHIEIVNPLVISTSQLNDGITGTAYSHTLSASGGYGNYAWSIYSGTLPDGLSLDSVSGTISGTPSDATFVSIVISVSDEEGRTTYRDLTLQVSEPMEILTATLPTALWDNLYSEAIRINGGIGPFIYDYTGQLPAGLSLNSSTGIISGTPTIAGYTNVSITVTDSTWPTNQTVTQNLGIRVTNFLTMTTSAILPNAKKDIAINPIILGAGGGPSPYTWAVTGGYMPEGITLNPATGELSGTPTDSGDFVFTIQVTDSGSDTDTAEKEFFMHVSAELEIITGAIPDGAKDISYSATLEAKGGLLPYSWRIKSGTLPSGLSFNNFGIISGKPTTRQTYSFTVEVSDNDSPAQTAEHTYIIDIQDDLYVYTISIPNGRIDQAYQATVKASLGTPPYSWRLESGVLPPGLTLTGSPTIATLEGTPSSDGTYVFTLEVSDNGAPVKYAIREYTVDIYDDVVVESSGLNSAVRGEPHSDSILVTGGKLPYHFRIIDGSLPAGLTINSSTGHISGTADPVYGYSEEFTVRVLDSGNPSGFADKQFTIYVTNSLAITTGSIQAALQKAPYLADLESEGGISPHTWSIMHGLLPEGLALDESTGEISGAPLECRTFNFTVRLEDSSTEPEIATRAYNLDIVCCNDYDISGAIANGIDVTVTLSGDSSGTTTTLTNESYQFQHLTNGSYTITPSKADYGFEPAFRTITVNNRDVSSADFTMVIIDNDSDGLPDDIEEGWCTDPDDPDTDDDGIWDGTEDANHNGAQDPGETHPCNPDTDGDKMPDGWEVDNNLNPLVDDAAGDADGDDFNNLREYVAATDPRDIDDTPYFEADVEDFETGDFSKLPWLTTGDGLWAVTSNNVYNGSYSAESPNIDDAQIASLEVNLYCEAGDMSFWYSVDSEENYDFLKFYIDGALTDQWSGLMPYAQANYTLTTGMHHFKWEYEKDKSDSAGSDTAWIDDISFPGSVDSDSDGMPDGWEIDNDLNAISDNSSDDADGDLFTNYKEYMLNTDPMNPADKPALETGFDADFDLDGSDLARFVDGLSSGMLTEADLEEFARNFGK